VPRPRGWYLFRFNCFRIAVFPQWLLQVLRRDRPCLMLFLALLGDVPRTLSLNGPCVCPRLPI